MPAIDARAALAAVLGVDSWYSTARPNKKPPDGDWFCWLMMGGRGAGKTRAGAEWVLEQVNSGKRRVALCGPTSADTRDTMVEGASGILTISPDHNRPLFEPSKRRLTWANRAIATLYSADEPERLRGGQHDAAWCDELGSWRRPDAWSNLMFGLRGGASPRCVVTTTPRPTKLIRDLVMREGTDVVISRSSSYENRQHLAPAFFDQIIRRYEGTRLGRQEILAELLTDTPGALWTIDQLDALRLESSPPEMARIVVAIDPSGSQEGDECGVVAAGVDHDGRGYVLVDASGQYSPPDWANVAVRLYHELHADRIVAETNFGSGMVEATIRAIDPNVAYRGVTASRGKVARAEPIAALFEQRKVFLVRSFPQLEDQMTSFTSNFDRRIAGYSPGRVDALVWALTDLMAQPMKGYAVYEWARAKAEGRAIIPPGSNPLLAVYDEARARIAVGLNPFSTASEGQKRLVLQNPGGEHTDRSGAATGPLRPSTWVSGPQARPTYALGSVESDRGR